MSNQPMNCWRTTTAATVSNIGTFLVTFATGPVIFQVASNTGKPIVTDIPAPVIFWMFVVGSVLNIVGKQFMGLHAADNSEVKRINGLLPDGTPDPKVWKRIDV